MKLVTYRRAAFALSASLLSVIAAAQTTQSAGGLDIPQDAQILGQQDPNVRKATAIVNGEVITGTDIDHRLAILLAGNPQQVPPEQMAQLRAQTLRNLIDETLQIQAAAREEIRVPDARVTAMWNRYAEAFQQTPATFGAFLRSIGSSERSVRREIQGQLAWRGLLDARIQPFVQVGDEEVQEIIDQMNANRGRREYRVAEIFISSTPANAAEARANADRIRQLLQGGAPFAAVARQFSEASTAAVGGDLGWVRSEQLPPELASVVSEMPIGAVSSPVPLPGGYSIVAVQDARTLLVPDERDAVLSLMQMSLLFGPGTTEQQAQTRLQQLVAATQNMGGCGNAQATATRLGAELVSNDQIPARQLPPQLQQIILRMSVGEATPPVGNRERVSVFILCGRDDPEQATAPSFDQIYESLSEQRTNRRAQRLLRDLRRDAVIEYR